MPDFVNSDGSPKFYAVVDTHAKTVLATCNYVGEAARTMKDLERNGAGNLAMHNLTHPICPDWLQELIRSDPGYCAGRARMLDREAAGLRTKMEEIAARADEIERRAAVWRDRMQAVSGRGPEDSPEDSCKI